MSKVKAPTAVSNANNLPHRINRRLRSKWRKNILWIEASLKENGEKLSLAETKRAEAKAAWDKEPEDEMLKDKHRMASIRVARLTKAPSEQRSLLKILKQKLEDNPAAMSV
jgi:hypothetical protein